MLARRSLCSLIVGLLAMAGVASAATPALSTPEVEHELLVRNPLSSTGSCGVERWSVKTGTDPDAYLVSLTNPVRQTVAYLDGLPAPSSLPANGRVQPTETTLFVVDATLVQYKLESDSDYHLVLKDAQGNTMIAEIPDPACVGSGSPFAPGIQNARSEFDAKYIATTSFQSANIPVEVRGVGFFDFDHGQTGVAPNAVELHPVLDIVFNPTGTGDVPPVASFTDTTNGLIVAFTNTSKDSDGTVVSSAWNFGDGSTSTATSPNHAYVNPGTYNVALTVSDNGGMTGTTTQSVMVTSGGSGGSQLLGNPGFENDTAAPWTISSGALCTNSACSGETAHGGSGFVWLDGYGSTHTDTASQTVTIPSGNTSATLSFWLHVDTAESSTTHAYDTMKVQVFDTSGHLLDTVSQFSNLNAASGYQEHSASLNAYIGKSIVVKFIGTEDGSLQTSFVLDNVGLTVH